jgi:hypothetical protein
MSNTCPLHGKAFMGVRRVRRVRQTKNTFTARKANFQNKQLTIKTLRLMLNISLGSLVSGSTGKKYKVDRIEGDFIYSGKLRIARSLILQAEPPPLIDRLSSIAFLIESEAIVKLRDITAKFSVNSIYESSLDLHTFAGIFIRRLLAEINPPEFDEIGADGSNGKYGMITYPDSPPQTESDKVGTRVTHADLYHRYGADIGTIELVDTFGDYRVRWDSDGHVGRYSADSLKWCEI